MRLQPEGRAATVNAALVLLAPVAFLAYADYTMDAVRPYTPTLLTSFARAVPGLLGAAPIAALVAWRTYAHARAYRQNPRTVWRGPVESAAVGAAIALVILVRATAGTWAREPAHLVAAYIGFYVGATALAGLLLGLVLAASALAVVHLPSRSH